MLQTQLKKTNSLLKSTLLLINSKEEFDKIICQNLQYSQIDQNSIEGEENDSQKNEQNIVVPKWGKLSESKLNKTKSKLNAPIFHTGYFRLRNHSIMPDSSKYEPNSEDMEFIKHLKATYSFKNKYKIQSKTFVQIIQSCEHNLYKEKVINLEDPPQHILHHLDFNLPVSLISYSQLQKKQLNSLILIVIEYWKKVKAQRHNFPLLRKYAPKTQISMSKYDFWLPFKSRVLDQNRKKSLTSQLRNLGQIQKQAKITKHTKQTANFYNQVKNLAEVHLHQYLVFKKQSYDFHKHAALLDFECPKYLLDIVQDNQKKNFKSALNKLYGQSYFRNPFVKFSSTSKLKFSLDFHLQYIVKYDPSIKQDFHVQQIVSYDPSIKQIKAKKVVLDQKVKPNSLKPVKKPNFSIQLSKNKYKKTKTYYFEEGLNDRKKKVKLQ